MSEIKINKDRLAQQIAGLRKLSESIDTHATKDPADTDNGSSTTEATARALWADYTNLSIALKNLIDNSASFYQHALETMAAADNTAARRVEGK